MKKHTFTYEHRNGNFGFQNQLTVEAQDDIQARKKAKSELIAVYGADRMRFFRLKIDDQWIKVKDIN